MMTLRLRRRYRGDTYTIGGITIDGTPQCDTLEDRDRGLRQTDSPESIRGRKVYGETAIPTGRYRVAMDAVSPKYASVRWYRDLCGGRMPRLANVPGFDGILIHPGNTALDTYGCILVGRNTAKGRLTSSRDTFASLYRKMRAAADRGEDIYIVIE